MPDIVFAYPDNNPANPPVAVETTALPANTAAVAQAVAAYSQANPPSVGDASITVAKLATDAVNLIGSKADASATTSALAGKQDALVSGMNIKTINGTTILGSGNIVAGGGSGPSVLKSSVTQIVNGTAFRDVTGQTFPVVAGTLYYFSFYIVFRSAATTTGYRFSVNCPAGALDYMHQYQTVANSDTAGVATWLEKHSVNRDVMTALTAAIAANVDLCNRIEGTYLCTAGGTFALRAASELANNDIVIQRVVGMYV